MQKMVCFEHDTNTLRMDRIFDSFGDLLREALLHLQTARENVDDARNLAEADHLVVRHVCDVRLAEERNEVMLALRVELDVFDDHHLVVIDVEERTVQNVFDLLIVALSEET